MEKSVFVQGFGKQFVFTKGRKIENLQRGMVYGSQIPRIPWGTRRSNYYHGFRNIVAQGKDSARISQPDQKQQQKFATCPILTLVTTIFFSTNLHNKQKRLHSTYRDVASPPCKTSVTVARE